ncbi:MAG: DUF3365 domain-containing protein [bacterium]
MRLRLRSTLLLLSLVGVLVPIGLFSVYLFYQSRQDIKTAFVNQGRAMFNQIVITRRWLARHGGVYVRKAPFVEPIPFLNGADTATLSGEPITLRSPEVVTREMSELSEKEGISSFRLVSLNPINPSNRPDAWEARSLQAFKEGKKESYVLKDEGPRPTFRYMAPIKSEASCMKCHQERAFKVGQVRGGISIEFPVEGNLVQARGAAVQLMVAILALGIIMFAILWLGSRRFFLKPISRISNAVSAMGGGNYDYPLAPMRDDELGELAESFTEMRELVRNYNRQLESEVRHRTEELTLMQERAQQERDFLINLFERMADGLCVVFGDEHYIEYINPSLEAAFGSAAGKKCHELLFGRDEPCEYCPFSGDRGDGLQKREVQVPDSNKVYEVLETELGNPDGTMSWLLVFRDITERKWLETELFEINRNLEAKVQEQTEALLEQERLATLGEVSAGLAHEIRNPLSAILSGISLLESGRRTAEENERIISLIRREARRLNSSLTDFLLFAKPQEPNRVRIDLVGLVREIVQLIEEDAELKGKVEIVTELEQMPPVLFDDGQLRQLIWNVCLNALQAMEGEGVLTVRVSPESAVSWRLEVEDTGPGIPKEFWEKIYNPFYSTKKEGTGLGLSIVRRIVNAHGGSIQCLSEPGQGTRFIVIVPNEGEGLSRAGASEKPGLVDNP